MSTHRCDLLITTDLITSLLSPTDQELLHIINTNTTHTITNTVCPNTLQSSPTNKICFTSINNATKRTNNFTPTNVNLYGSTICSQLSNLNILGLTNKQIYALDQKYKVTWPWSVQFDSDRLGNNKRVQQFPLLIIYPKTPADIQYWIKLARHHSLTPSIRSGGHSYEGFSMSGQLVIDMSYLELPCSRKQVIVHKSSVDVSPGTRLGPLYAKVAKKNLQLVGGICPSVAIGGYISGSGVGYFIRKYGYGCDSLLEADIILADGSLLTTNECKNSDLFRSIKGAGWAGLGIITRYKLQVYPLVKVVYFTYTFDLNDAAIAIFHLQNLVTAPDNLSGLVVNLAAGIPILTINGIYFPTTSSPVNELKTLLNTLFFSVISPITPLTSNVELKSWLDIDTELGLETPTIPNYKNRSSYIFEPLSVNALNSIIDYLAVPVKGSGDFLTAFQYLIFGGKVNSIPAKTSVVVAREGTVGWVQLGMYWSDSNSIFQSYQYVNDLYNLLINSGGSTTSDPNVPDLLLTNYMKSYWGDNVKFLIDVKDRVDPSNFFTGAQTIPVIK